MDRPHQVEEAASQLHPCPDCGLPLSPYISKCPHCGRRSRRATTPDEVKRRLFHQQILVMLGAVGVFLILLFIIWLFGGPLELPRRN